MYLSIGVDKMDRLNRKPLLALIYRIIGLLVGITALALQVYSSTLTDAGFMIRHNWAYFTIQTNIFSTIIFFVLVIKTFAIRKVKEEWEVARINESVHLCFTFYITITFLGYWLLLLPTTGLNSNPAILAGTIFLHALTPLFAVFDCVFFMKHGKIKSKDVIKWMTYPVVHLISVVIFSKLIKTPYYTVKIGEKVFDLMFPYPFIDPQIMGTWGVVAAVLALAGVFVLLGLLFITIDKRLSKKK